MNMNERLMRNRCSAPRWQGGVEMKRILLAQPKKRFPQASGYHWLFYLMYHIIRYELQHNAGTYVKSKNLLDKSKIFRVLQVTLHREGLFLHFSHNGSSSFHVFLQKCKKKQPHTKRRPTLATPARLWGCESNAGHGRCRMLEESGNTLAEVLDGASVVGAAAINGLSGVLTAH